MKSKYSLIAASALILALPFAHAGNGKVEKREYVCMMQDMILTKPGVPIQYEGKTYYGCCEMCKEKIKNEPKKYTLGVDPVSGKQVDKASAWIYDLNGDAYYFSSESNLKRFEKNPEKFIKK